MGKFRELMIFSNNEMERNGFKSFFEIHRPKYKVNIIFTTPSSTTKLFTGQADNSLIIFDTDCIEQKHILDFLQNCARNEIKCIIYSRLNTPGLLIKARQMGISGYVSKASSLERLLDCLKVIELGGIYYDSCFSALLKEISDFSQILSPMQQNLLYEALLFPNRSIREIAESLKISKHTAEVHLYNLYQKIGLHTFNELVEKFSLCAAQI